MALISKIEIQNQISYFKQPKLSKNNPDFSLCLLTSKRKIKKYKKRFFFTLGKLVGLDTGKTCWS